MSDRIPTACDGKKWSNGKPKPVALVATMVVKKRPVHPSCLALVSSPYRTTTPATIATRLRTTWMKVNVGMPRIIGASSVDDPILWRAKPSRTAADRWCQAGAEDHRCELLRGLTPCAVRAAGLAPRQWTDARARSIARVRLAIPSACHVDRG